MLSHAARILRDVAARRGGDLPQAVAGLVADTIARELIGFDLDRVRALYRGQYREIVGEILAPAETASVEALVVFALEDRFRDDHLACVERLYAQCRRGEYEASATLLIASMLRDVRNSREREKRTHAIAVDLAFARVGAGDADADQALEEARRVAAEAVGVGKSYAE